jgi:hypothetical protein
MPTRGRLERYEASHLVSGSSWRKRMLAVGAVLTRRRRGWKTHPRARKSGFFACFEANKEAIKAREEHADADTAI